MPIAQRVAAVLPAETVKWIGRQQFRPIVGPVVKRATRGMRSGAAVIQHGPGTGLLFDPAGTNAGYALGTTEPLVQDTLVRELGDGVLWDLGANVGFYTVIAARQASRVVAFEPVPANVAALKRNAALNNFHNVTVRQFAVSSEVGESVIQLYDTATWAKLEDAGSKENRTLTGRLPVHTTTLDHELAAGLPAPALVKIDVEGAEVLALQGAQRLLKEVRPTLMIELHGTDQRDGVLAILHDAGYHVNVLGGGDAANAAWYAYLLARAA